MGTIKQNYGNQLTVTVDHIGLVNKWDVSVRGHDGLRVATGRSRNLDRAIRKALRVAVGKEATFMTVEQYRQKQIDQRVRESEKTITQLRQQINHLEGHCLEVESANGTREMFGDEPLKAEQMREYVHETVRYDTDGIPVSYVARSSARPEDLFRQQAGAWCDSIETRLVALQKDFDQHVEDQMDRNMGFEGEDKLLAQTIGVAERRAVEADREITAMLAAAERQLISAVNTLEERVAALETKRPTKETPK